MPLSDDPIKRTRQLANLRPVPAPPAPVGNQRARRHGGTAQVAAERLDAQQRAIFDALAADAPVRGADGDLPAADAVLVMLLAQALCRLEDVGAHLRDHGLLDARGNMRNAVEVEAKLRREAADYADAMGMTPRSRARLGLDLVRSIDLAQAWAADADADAGPVDVDVLDADDDEDGHDG